jgi:hypothetical protein
MALDPRTGGRWWSRLHFLIRLIGVTGLVVATVGLALILIDAGGNAQAVEDRLQKEITNLQGEVEPARLPLEVGLLAGGLVAGAFFLVLEVIVVLRYVSGRRSAVGFNAVVQVALAVVLLIGVNMYAFQHYERFDWTREREFTLEKQPQDELALLQRRTNIVIFLRHKSFGQMSDKPDVYDFAAERKVVEKVKDLAEQFQEVGPQFKVEVLDVEGEHFASKFKKVSRELAENALQRRNQKPPTDADIEEKAKEIRKLIQAVPDNNVFFFRNRNVQRLSFDELYHLDKVASKKRLDAARKSVEEDEEGPETNLVLLDQGVRPFARQVLAINQRRPRIGVLTVHEALTTEADIEFGMRGLRDTLTARGMDVEDVVLKEPNLQDAVAYTFEEYRLGKLDRRLAAIPVEKKLYEHNIDVLGKAIENLKKKSIADLSREYETEVTEEMKAKRLAKLEEFLVNQKHDLAQVEQEREDAETLQRAAEDDERLREQLRMIDPKAKLAARLRSYDLIIVPRPTVMSLSPPRMIPGEISKLEDWQTDAIKEYLKSGKPMLVCFGPEKEPARGGMPSMPARKDGLDGLLNELGVEMDAPLVLFDVESRQMAEMKSDDWMPVGKIDVPPLLFDWSAPEDMSGLDKGLKLKAEKRPPNPLRHSMQVVVNSAGSSFRLPPHHPRPVRVERKTAAALKYDPELMATQGASWAEDNPYPSLGRVPRFDNNKQRGPIPVGVAFDATLPASWFKGSNEKPPTVRLVALGDGYQFSDRKLSPAQEQFLLNTCNWLLGRDDQLPSDTTSASEGKPASVGKASTAGKEWRFPRVEMSRREHDLWQWTAWLGLPALFAYLGVVVLLVRRLR